MSDHPEAGVVGAYILNPDGTPQWCFGRFPTILSETACAWGLNTRSRFSTGYGPGSTFATDSLEVDWVLGAGPHGAEGGAGSSRIAGL